MKEAEQHELVRELLEELFDLPPEEQRRVLSERELPAGVEERVLSVLGYEPGVTAFNERDEGGLERRLQRLGEAVPAEPHDEALPESIAGFAIEGVLGRGGMGIVYRGVQAQPRREVAIKVLHALSVSPDRLRRFEYEAEVLARLDHPNVAKVFQAGIDRVPYIAMELVDGRDILAHCEAKELSIEDRLRLFRGVCEGVQHAHQHGVVHRDLKPANILVSRDGRPRLLDFGIARPVELGERETPGQTMTGDMLGSLAWMSPEQARGELSAIDTRTDVYALGVLLYRLLSGEMPYDVSNLAPWNAARVVCEEEPKRLGSHGAHLAGDLEAICAMALDKEIARRYPSAGAFGRDVERFLDNSPIDARAWSATYHLRKLVRRHRGLTTALASLLAVLIGSLVALNYVQAEARAEVEAQAEIAREVNRFLNEDLLAAVRPSNEAGRGIDVSMREVLDEAAKRIETAARPGGRFFDKPLVEAQIRTTLADTYADLAELDLARPHAERAFVLRAQELGEEHVETLDALATRLRIDVQARRGESLRPFAEECLAQAQRVLGDDHEVTLAILHSVGSFYLHREDLDRAEALLTKAWEGRRAKLGEADRATLNSLEQRGELYRVAGRYAELERVAQRSLAIHREAFGERHDATADAMQQLAMYYLRMERHADAEPLMRNVVAIRTELQGPRHAETIAAQNDLAICLRGPEYGDDRKENEAEAILAEYLPIAEEVLGVHHPTTVTMRSNLGNLYGERGRGAEALTLLEANLAYEREAFGDGHSSTIYTWYKLGGVLKSLGRADDAEATYHDCLDAAEAELGEEHPLTQTVLYQLTAFLIEQGRPAEALEFARLGHRLRSRALGEGNSDTLLSHLSIGLALRDLGRLDEAEEVFEECIALRKEHTGMDDWDTWGAITVLAELHESRGNTDAAVAGLQEVLECIIRVRGEHDHDAINHYARIGDIYMAGQRFAEAEPYFRRGVELCREADGMDEEFAQIILNFLVDSLILTDRYEEALPLAEELLARTPEDHPWIEVRRECVASSRKELGLPEAGEPVPAASKP
ncbi:MAG: serine/threonine-protein kinase [Planctomycetota bacterium]